MFCAPQLLFVAKMPVSEETEHAVETVVPTSGDVRQALFPERLFPAEAAPAPLSLVVLSVKSCGRASGSPTAHWKRAMVSDMKSELLFTSNSSFRDRTIRSSMGARSA
jgi:hypothetical protein